MFIYCLDYCMKTVGLSKGVVLKLFDYSDVNTALSLREMGDIQDAEAVDLKLTEQCRQLVSFYVLLTYKRLSVLDCLGNYVPYIYAPSKAPHKSYNLK